MAVGIRQQACHTLGDPYRTYGMTHLRRSSCRPKHHRPFLGSSPIIENRSRGVKSEESAILPNRAIKTCEEILIVNEIKTQYNYL
jgi:hypothetical protein